MVPPGPIRSNVLFASTGVARFLIGTQLEQDLHAMALNLVVAAITLWNTAYLDRALKSVQNHGISLPAQYLPHISPLGWEHIAITGTYQWKGTESAWGRFRPLRLSALDQLAAYKA